MGSINLRTVPPELQEIFKQIDNDESIHGSDDSTKGDNVLSTEQEVSIFYNTLKQNVEGFNELSDEQLAEMYENGTPSTFKKIMNPDAIAVNWLSGGKGDDNFKSYLNPLFSYSDEKNVTKTEKWIDPLATTVNANSKTSHYYLNPIHTLASKNYDTEHGPSKAYAVMDPGMATVTSFIKNEKAANVTRTLLNPVAALVSKIFTKSNKEEEQAK